MVTALTVNSNRTGKWCLELLEIFLVIPGILLYSRITDRKKAETPQTIHFRITGGFSPAHRRISQLLSGKLAVTFHTRIPGDFTCENNLFYIVSRGLTSEKN